MQNFRRMPSDKTYTALCVLELYMCCINNRQQSFLNLLNGYAELLTNIRRIKMYNNHNSHF